MKVHKKSSVAPIYLLGLTWLVYALLFPDGSVQLLHAFSAELDSTFWQNAVTLRSNASLSEVTGRMFYTQSGVSKTAALPFSETVYSSGTDLFGLPFYSYQAESALFSWPLGSRDRWGYVIAAADQEANPQTVLDDTLGYATSPRPAYQSSYKLPDKRHAES